MISDWIILDQIGSDWIRLDQIGSDNLKMTWGRLETDLGISRSTLDTLAACFRKNQIKNRASFLCLLLKFWSDHENASQKRSSQKWHGVPHLKNQITKTIPCTLYIDNHCMIFIFRDIYWKGFVKKAWADIYKQMY